MIYAENILVCIAVPFLVSLFFIRGEGQEQYRHSYGGRETKTDLHIHICKEVNYGRTF